RRGRPSFPTRRSSDLSEIAMQSVRPLAMNHGTAEMGVRTRPPRSWRSKFRDALRGVKLGIRGHSSFFVHFFFAALVIAAAIVLGDRKSTRLNSSHVSI